jgi:hypothetical protein
MNKIFFLLLILSGFTCFSGHNKEGFITNYSENDKGDSILYYRDFDWCNFKGLERISIKELRYPFVKMIYSRKKLVLKAHYSESKTNQISFFKLQDKWCSHFWHFYDGDQNHHFVISMDSFMLELRFAGNPVDAASAVSAKLRSVSIKRAMRDTISENIYSYFFNYDINHIPDLKSFNEKDFERMCSQVIYAKTLILNDSIRMGYTAYDRTNSAKRIVDKWSWKNYPLLHKSMFYFYFEKMKEGDTNLTPSEKIKNLENALEKMKE